MQECPNCNGNGWLSGSEAGHGCDGTDEDCGRSCPIEIQIQVGCKMCGGSGSSIEDENNLMTEVEQAYNLNKTY